MYPSRLLNQTPNTTVLRTQLLTSNGGFSSATVSKLRLFMVCVWFSHDLLFDARLGVHLDDVPENPRPFIEKCISLFGQVNKINVFIREGLDSIIRRSCARNAGV